MKKILLSLVFCFALASVWAQSIDTSAHPSCKPVIIKPLGFRNHQGNRLKPAALRLTLACAGDKKVLDGYKVGHAMDWIGASLVTAGSILVMSASGNSYEYTDKELQMGRWGLETMGVGLGFQLGGLMVKKMAVKRYNRLAAGPLNLPNQPAETTAKRFAGLSFGKTYIKRGVELPDEMYSDGIWFDRNREIANSGFYLSLFTERVVSGRFQTRAELTWVQRGFGLSMQGNSYSYEVDTRSYALMNYLETAFLGQYSISTNKSLVLLSAGPGLGFLTSSRIKAKATVRDPQTGESESASSSAKGNLESYTFGDRLDFGLHLGIGSRIPLMGNYLSVDLRYFLGMKNVNDDPYTPGKQHHRGWSLGLGYVIGM